MGYLWRKYKKSNEDSIMGENTEISGGIGILHLIFLIVFLFRFWDRTFGSIYVSEFFILYYWIVIFPILIIILIVIILALVN